MSCERGRRIRAWRWSWGRGGESRARQPGTSNALAGRVTAFAPAFAENDRATVLRILVVEDDADARELVLLALQGLGYPCRAVADAETAREAIAEGSVDVVLCDCSLPGMSGIDLCRELRLSADGRSTYFVLVTGFGDREHLIDAIDAGADDVQRKPVDLDELEARLILAGRRHAR